MHDDFQPGLDDVDALDGATPRLFPRVFIAADDETEAGRDARVLAAVLAGHTEAVAAPEGADLIVTGSAPFGVANRVTLDEIGRAVFESARCPVAVAPLRLAERRDYELRRIDVGIDGGRGAAAAVALAVRLALAHSARLRLVAVAQPGFDPVGAPRRADPHELERLGRHLKQAAESLPGLWVETELREGPVDQIILGLAGESDLLLLGSQAAFGNAGRVALGEVAARTLRAAPCPTMIVPAP
ncbi:MAG: universal stress protein [Actinobacteria bacterium]|nr:universal stress protein [Actinomycetota bacterium]